MPTTGVFHPGRQHSWQTAAALQEAAALSWYATAIYDNPSRFPYSVARKIPGSIGSRLRAKLESRSSDLIDPDKVRSVPALEWSELLAARLGQRAIASGINRIGNRMFQRGMARLASREPVDRLWGYDTSCDWLFGHPAAARCIRVLDQTAGHSGVVREILTSHRNRHPEYFPDDADIPSDDAVAQANREVARASHIVVGAQHAADALVARGVDRERVHVNSYGFDERRFPSERIERPTLGTLPVRFLFVGAVGPRKGIHLLLEAFRRFSPDQAHLKLVGPLAMPGDFLRGHRTNVEYSPALPHTRIVEEYAKAHCFVFPTLIDGGGIVLYEAAACGLGIIQSSMCGDGVRDGDRGVNGIVLADNTVDQLRAAMEQVVADPGMLRDWSAASWAMRQERTWSAYRRRLVALLPRLV